MYYDILDENRKSILPLFQEFKKDFYLAGGTALVLHLGHRDSVDFDFFSSEDINTRKLFDRLIEIFKGHKIVKIQEEENTLGLIIDDEIKLSFMSYKYDLLGDTQDEGFLKLASVIDIGCMKLSAITSRSTLKDYVDLYFILNDIRLVDLLKFAGQKFPNLDMNLILKSLIYFDDVDETPIMFKHGKDISFEKIKKYLEVEVRKIIG